MINETNLEMHGPDIELSAEAVHTLSLFSTSSRPTRRNLVP